MSKKISLTGIKPTGLPHWGNYFGAMKPAIEMTQTENFDGHYFIADYHSLSTIHKGPELKELIYGVAASWLACGLDPEKTVLYKQSDVPEVLEMHWILSCFTNKGLMNRAHAYKAAVQDNEENKRDSDKGINLGLYTYPILMSADILFINSEIVPVGEDQVQHIEIARDIASAFNHIYGDTFRLPEALVQKEKLVTGLDGRKMSKSYGNHISLFENEKRLKKLINKIKTDSTEPGESKNINDSIIFDLYKFFATKEEIKEFEQSYADGISWGEAKVCLFEKANNHFDEPRRRYEHLMSNRNEIDDILYEGAKRMRPKAQEFLQIVKEKIGVL